MKSQSILAGIYLTLSLLTLGIIIYMIDIQSNISSRFDFGTYFLASLIRPTVNTILFALCAVLLFKRNQFAIHVSILAILLNILHMSYNMIFHFDSDYYSSKEAILVISGFASIISLVGFLTWRISKKPENQIEK
jgi:hypothetical protein